MKSVQQIQSMLEAQGDAVSAREDQQIRDQMARHEEAALAHEKETARFKGAVAFLEKYREGIPDDSSDLGVDVGLRGHARELSEWEKGLLLALRQRVDARRDACVREMDALGDLQDRIQTDREERARVAQALRRKHEDDLANLVRVLEASGMRVVPVAGKAAK